MLELATGEPEDWAKELPGEKVFHKHTFDAFLNTGLAEYLHQQGKYSMYQVMTVIL